MARTFKGQIGLINLVVFVMALIAFFALLPALSEIIDATVTILQTNPNSSTPLIVGLIQLSPFFILLAMIAGIFVLAVPQRQLGYG
jgi:hypothetical protein